MKQEDDFTMDGNRKSDNLPVFPGGTRRAASRRTVPVSPMNADMAFQRFDTLFRDISGFFEEMFNSTPGWIGAEDLQIRQTDQEVVVTAEIPGLSQDSLNVEINEDSIMISGRQQRSNEYRSLNDEACRLQKSCSSFFRSFPLPEGVDHLKARVEYKGSTLHIFIPKK